MRFLSIVLASLLLAACASTGDVRAVEDDLADLEDTVAELTRSASSRAEVEALNRSLAEQTQTILRSNAEVTARVGQMDERITNTQGSLEETNYRIDRLAQQVNDLRREVETIRAMLVSMQQPAATPGGAPVTIPMEEVTVQSPPAPAAAAGDPLELYAAAYRDYQLGNFDLAVAGFAEFLANNPESDLADNAAYWIGESYFSQQKYPEAIQQFDQVITQYPRSDKVPAALLKKGYSYLETGERAQGIIQLQYVLHEHPGTPEANLASQRLRTLGVS
ncbi:MAG: tol-pal system protein YbgF [Thermoanaerobaculia bacterium]